MARAIVTLHCPTVNPKQQLKISRHIFFFSLAVFCRSILVVVFFFVIVSRVQYKLQCGPVPVEYIAPDLTLSAHAALNIRDASLRLVSNDDVDEFVVVVVVVNEKVDLIFVLFRARVCVLSLIKARGTLAHNDIACGENAKSKQTLIKHIHTHSKLFIVL